MTVVDAAVLLRAAGDGDLEALGRFLESDRACANLVGANPYWGGRVQPLHLAVIWGQREAVAMLLEAGADPSGENEGYGGWSPLLLAATKGQTAIADQLIEVGAYVGLFEASALGRARDVADILDGNADRSQQVLLDGTTPLHVAGSPDVTDLLLGAGGLLEIRDGYGSTPLDAAVSRAARRDPQTGEVAERLLAAGAEADVATHAALGHVARVASALDGDIGALARHTRTGRTPLCSAVGHGRREVVKQLLERGADPNLPDGDGIYPLHWVASAPRHGVDLARLLLAAGATLDVRDGQHQATPRSWAEFQRKPDLVRVLSATASD